MPVLRLPDVELHYEVSGSGPPLLLVAGLASDGAYWLPAVEPLARHCRVIVVDNRGSGRTAPQDVPITIGAMAADCAALLRHLDCGRATIVGHSMGGMIAQDCAVRYPDLVERAVLVATGAINSARNNDLFASWAEMLDAGMPSSLWFRNLFYWVLSSAFFQNRATVDALVTLATTYPYQQSALAFRRQTEALAAFDGTAGLPAPRVPTLVLAGSDDALFPLAANVAFAAAIPGAQFLALDGAAHSIPAETPELVVAKVLAFMRVG